MDDLFNAIDTTPIIDHHAHNLLLPHEIGIRQLISITTEAGEGPIKDTPSSLSHLRAVKQLSEVLGCSSDWASVEAAIVEKRKEPDNAWTRKCFEGIETVLIDDGLDEETVYPWDWHHRLTRSECKRIARIEKIAESILKRSLQAKGQAGESREIDSMEIFEIWETTFIATIKKAIRDPNVVGFKSVICYRTGLAIANFSSNNTHLKSAMDRILSSGSIRLEDKVLSPYFVHLTAQLISESKEPRKPFQFHTGLGDNDITLSLASPSHMQPFIKTYPNVPIVLLHASYPFTKEAGYLASVYDNVFFDIGEVFPMVSQDGQENLLRESLELCPSQKLCWSTDGHWFPETYLLAIIQVREAMKKVLGDTVARGALELKEAIQIIHDILFNTSNKLYHLGLTLKPLSQFQNHAVSMKGAKIANLDILNSFLKKNPSIRYLRIQWIDYVTTFKLRVVPIKLAVDMFQKQKSIGITKAVFGLLHQDEMVPTFSPVGEYELLPCFEGLRLGFRDGYATVQGEFHEKDGSEVMLDPRSALRRIVEKAKKHDLSFLIGFELEVVFMTATIVDGTYVYGKDPITHGHAWSNASAMRNSKIMEVIEEILMKLERAQINVEQFHPESAPGQYEFVTGCLPPLEAVDTLISTQDIIYSVAEEHSFKATFVPKPYAPACGTGAHVHTSISPEDDYPSFYAGILKHLPAIAAFTYANSTSYDRVQDGVWSGGRYVAWGTQNRETPLRKVSGSHWEIKCMDGIANKYLAMAALLGTGLQGILDKQAMIHKDCSTDPAKLDDEGREKLGITDRLPADLSAALQRLDKDKVLRNILGEDLVNTYLTVKYAEIEMLDGMDKEERRNFLLARY